jgi:16S rRNA (guanine(966)-N(2))-methyltransferase RsmD
MRIIAGKHKGRALKMPAGIRPTQNKVREALFDILGDIEGLAFLELFAGSGAVGLEAVSRGAGEAVLVEDKRECVLAIEQNIARLGEGGCTLYPLEAEAAIGRLSREGRSFDLVFLDPPYRKGLVAPGFEGGAGVPLSAAKKTLQLLSGCDILTPHGLVIVQHFKRDELPEACGELNLIKEARYGQTVLSIYRKKDDFSRDK